MFPLKPPKLLSTEPKKKKSRLLLSIFILPDTHSKRENERARTQMGIKLSESISSSHQCLIVVQINFSIFPCVTKCRRHPSRGVCTPPNVRIICRISHDVRLPRIRAMCGYDANGDDINKTTVMYSTEHFQIYNVPISHEEKSERRNCERAREKNRGERKKKKWRLLKRARKVVINTCAR